MSRVKELQKSLFGGTTSNARQFGMIFTLVAIVLLFQVLTDGLTLNSGNLISLVSQYSYILILAIGMLMVIVAGHIDLSVGSIAAFVGIVVGPPAARHHASARTAPSPAGRAAPPTARTAPARAASRDPGTCAACRAPEARPACPSGDRRSCRRPRGHRWNRPWRPAVRPGPARRRRAVARRNRTCPRDPAGPGNRTCRTGPRPAASPRSPACPA
ncbi:hypothetical protein [Streptosporangium vulgare]|uniref:hypothetical protein n=1 Tax=Streptosporangium vulgare TaxID=46190 RepID=UPI0031E0E4ED